MSIRVGFASRDGKKVDECLLASSAWWIYDVGDSIQLVEERKGIGGCDIGCAQCREGILKELEDCDLLFACGCETKIASFLLARGKQIVQTKASVEQMVREVYRKNSQKISLDYYRKVQSLWLDYQTSAEA